MYFSTNILTFINYWRDYGAREPFSSFGNSRSDFAVNDSGLYTDPFDTTRTLKPSQIFTEVQQRVLFDPIDWVQSDQATTDTYISPCVVNSTKGSLIFS